MVAAGAFAARDTGFLRTPGWPTRKLIWANWGAPERSNRKRDRCSVQAAEELGFSPKWGQPWGAPLRCCENPAALLSGPGSLLSPYQARARYGATLEPKIPV